MSSNSSSTRALLTKLIEFIVMSEGDRLVAAACERAGEVWEFGKRPRDLGCAGLGEVVGVSTDRCVGVDG